MKYIRDYAGKLVFTIDDEGFIVNKRKGHTVRIRINSSDGTIELDGATITNK